MKYVDTKIVFQEIPGETTLAINISNCPCKCQGCHSSYLADDIGQALNYWSLKQLILKNEGITCVSFMGGDAEPIRIDAFASWVKDNFQGMKTAWYSGRQQLAKEIDLKNFDFIKVGPYIEENGPLTSRTTNQIMYEVVDGYKLKNITHKFWKNHEV